MKEERLIWLKEQIIPLSKAKINILAPTSQFGANVFEGMRCYWNEEEKQLYGFRLKEHFERLEKSSIEIGFKQKYSQKEMKDKFISIIIANKYKEDIAVRQTLFLDGFGSWNSTEPIEMFIAPIKKGREPNSEKGLTCCISSWERINEKSISPKIKCGANYINSRMAQLEAKEKGYDTALFLNNKGTISEAPGSCVFIIKENKLITPPLSASILDSITRKTIIEISQKELRLEVIEKNITPRELINSEEIFLCGTAIEIMPIIKIENKIINKEIIGEITKKIREEYFKIVRGKNKKYFDWLTPIYQKR